MGQTGKNIVLSLKAQAGLGTPASGTGGVGIRARASAGINLTNATIQSGEIRRDGQTTLGRLGSYFANAGYETEVSVGTLDTIFEAALRGTWTAAIALDESVGSLGGLTVGTATLSAAGGSWITQGVRAGQMIKLENHSEAANNDKWYRVLSVTTSVISCPAGSFTSASEDAAWDITVAKHLICASPPVERYFTVDEYLQDIDQSKTGVDCKFGSISLSVSPNNMAVVGFTLAGTDVTSNATGASPVLTTPTFTTSPPLVFLDGLIRVNGVDVVDLTNFQLNFTANPQGLAVIGQRASPDVYMGNAVGDGTLSGAINDLTEFDSFKAEDNIELFLLAQENEDAPKDFVSIYAGNAAYRGHQAPFGADGAMIETLPFAFGVDERGTGYAPSMLVISTSAA
jgi:hypothetical protein